MAKEERMALDAINAIANADFSNRSDISISIMTKDKRGKRFEITPEDLEVYGYFDWFKRVIALSEADVIIIIKIISIGYDTHRFANGVLTRQVYRNGDDWTTCLKLDAEDVDSNGSIIFPTNNSAPYKIDPKQIKPSGESQNEDWITGKLYKSNLFSDPGTLSLVDEINAIDFANHINNAK
ncbi:hypothetical protein [uncultured Ferrimonas sp.]|uniref:hypothetical protein n=1 Tax=uncultured Ferrimonas sp. TaxID=432640 RepID=UPI002620C189|nr:hypothetical protein [uncultured Ferrimonas sp.]